MNGGYLIIVLSRQGIEDEKLPDYFENVEDFVFTIAKKNMDILQVVLQWEVIKI